MPDAHKAPAVARSVNPAMKIAVSNRVISQLLRIAAPQSLNCSAWRWHEKLWRRLFLGGFVTIADQLCVDARMAAPIAPRDFPKHLVTEKF
jgi:hypothetical protein